MNRLAVVATVLMGMAAPVFAQHGGGHGGGVGGGGHAGFSGGHAAGPVSGPSFGGAHGGFGGAAPVRSGGGPVFGGGARFTRPGYPSGPRGTPGPISRGYGFAGAPRFSGTPRPITSPRFASNLRTVPRYGQAGSAASRGNFREPYRGNVSNRRGSDGHDHDRDHDRDRDDRRRDHRDHFRDGYGYGFVPWVTPWVGWIGPDWLGYPDDFGYDDSSAYANNGYDGYNGYDAQAYQGPPYVSPDDDDSLPGPRPEYRPSGESIQSAPVEDVTAATLIFKDGRAPEHVRNYMLSRSTVFVMDRPRREIPVTELDLAATEKANRDAGVDFRLPGAGN